MATKPLTDLSAGCLKTNATLPDGKICIYDNSKYRTVVNEPSFEQQTKIIDDWYVVVQMLTVLGY